MSPGISTFSLGVYVFGSKHLVQSRVSFNGLWPGGLKHFAKDVGNTFWDCVWPCLDPWDSVRLRTASTHWNVPRKCGPQGVLFFFLIKKEPVVASDEVLPNPFCLCGTLETCAMLGLHLLAAEGEEGSGGQSPDLGDMWRHGCPMRSRMVQLVFDKCHLLWLCQPFKSLGRIGQVKW